MPRKHESLPDPVQARPVQSNLIIHTINLAGDTINMLVLLIHLLAHRHCQALQLARRAMQQIQVVIDLILHLLILAVRLKLVLAALRKACLVHLSLRCATKVASETVLAGGGCVCSLAAGVAGFALGAMRVQELPLAFILALLRGERVGDVHGEHAAVEGLELAGLLGGDAVLDGGEIEIALGVVDTFTLGTEALQGGSTGLVSLVGETEGVAGRRDVLLLDEANFLFLPKSSAVE